MAKTKLADFIVGTDHFAIPVRDIEFWKNEYVNNMGGVLFHETPDAYPRGASSMHLCGVLLGGVSIALIAGIDRTEKSQVTKFVERFGDHSFQHIAIRVNEIEKFVELAQKSGYRFLSGIHEREDQFGPVKQVFACKFDPTLPADEAPFYEFVERPQEGETFKSGDSFSDDFARELYKDVEHAPEATFVNYKMRTGNAK